VFEVARKTLSEQQKRFCGQSAEFIPYACHYNKHTILTKNGALIQTLRLVGFSAEFHQDDHTNIRTIIRNLLYNLGVLDVASLWFHTIRCGRNLFPHNKGTNNFPDILHTAWSNKNYWHNKFVNEIYISFVIQSEVLSTKNSSSFLGLLAPAPGKGLEKNLARDYQLLEEYVGKSLEALKPYGAERLEIVEDHEGIYSEFLQFFSRLIHLEEHRYSLPIIDLSEYLSTHHVFFGRNTLEISDNEQKKFAAILSPKEYQELLPSSMDSFLQLPFEFVITQFVDKAPLKHQLDQTAKQDYILRLSQDEALQQYFAFDPAIPPQSFFCSQQTTFMVIAPSREELTSRMKRFVDELQSHGMLITREDLALEDCFWSQLPGNFEHIRRLSNIPKHYLGGFAQLYSFAAGKMQNRWGHAVTILRNARNNPFFFNFHTEGAGNTCCIGALQEQQFLLQYFLLSESSRLSDRLLLLYCNSPVNKAFLRAMDIPLIEIPTTPSPLFAFMYLDDTPENHTYLSQWLTIPFTTQTEIPTEKVTQAIPPLLKSFFKTPAEKRNLQTLLSLLDQIPEAEPLKKLWVPWITSLLPYEGPVENDKMVTLAGSMGLNLNALSSLSRELKITFLLYLVHRLVQNAKQDVKTIIRIDNLVTLCEMGEPYIDFIDIMRALNQKNILFLCDLRLGGQKIPPSLQQFLQNDCDTLLFFEDKAGEKLYQEWFDFSKEDLATISSAAYINRLLIIIQENTKITIELNITGMPALRAILTGEEKALQLIEQEIVKHGPDPVEWLGYYMKAYEGK